MATIRRWDLFGAVVAFVCQWEAASLVGKRFDIPLLRRLPPVTRICGHHPARCGAVLVGLALHFATSKG